MIFRLQNKSAVLIALITGLLLASKSMFALEGQRYKDEVFKNLSTQKNITYGEAYNVSKDKNETLKLDVYEPEDDSEQKRPAIIWMHGGGFTSSSKSEDNIVALCEAFTKRGYVNVSISYRLSEKQDLTAVLQAYEDGKAAVRWLRANAQTYRVDPERIVIGGSSAGAISALHVAYEENEGNSGTPGVSSDVAACVDLRGALSDLNTMEPHEAPLIIVHGTADVKVPFFMAQLLESRAQAIGLPYEMHALQGVGHNTWNFLDEKIGWISDFLLEQVIQGAPTSVGENVAPDAFELLQSHPNPVSLKSPQTTVRYELSRPGNVELRLYNILGQQVRLLAQGRHEAGSYSRRINITGLPAGLYFYQLQTSQQITTKKLVIVR